jgi:hypothetical protein
VPFRRPAASSPNGDGRRFPNGDASGREASVKALIYRLEAAGSFPDAGLDAAGLVPRPQVNSADGTSVRGVFGGALGDA